MPHNIDFTAFWSWNGATFFFTQCVCYKLDLILEYNFQYLAKFVYTTSDCHYANAAWGEIKKKCNKYTFIYNSLSWFIWQQKSDLFCMVKCIKDNEMHEAFLFNRAFQELSGLSIDSFYAANVSDKQNGWQRHWISWWRRLVFCLSDNTEQNIY